MREIAAEWLGRRTEDLGPEAEWGLKNWGLQDGEYEDLHRFAVTQRRLFKTFEPLPGAPQAIRRLEMEGIHIRVITHRLFIAYFHVLAVAQTVDWLDHHGIPSWDLCFMHDKVAVGANLYVEDSPDNINALREANEPVLMMSNSTNAAVPDEPGGRASDWAHA
jgi:hypothetical protein